MIYVIDNGCSHEDHRVYFCETWLGQGELLELIEIEIGPVAERWATAEVPKLIMIADPCVWVAEKGPDTLQVFAQTPRGEIFWLQHEGSPALQAVREGEAVCAVRQLDHRVNGPFTRGVEWHRKWAPHEPALAELQWRAVGKKCGCGIHYSARAWLELPFAGYLVKPEDDDEQGEVLELRNCTCGSSLSRSHLLRFKHRDVRTFEARIVDEILQPGRLEHSIFTRTSLERALRLVSGVASVEIEERGPGSLLIRLLGADGLRAPLDSLAAAWALVERVRPVAIVVQIEGLLISEG